MLYFFFGGAFDAFIELILVKDKQQLKKNAKLQTVPTSY